ncbi:MAG: Hpt domain-containing protein [Gammaproteobacteria bacterium]|nr:Hpt domain-containing protein [Gammaproteobacteria bacterium]
MDESGEENRAKVIRIIKQELPMMIDGIDMTRALQNVGGDSELLRNVLIKFYETHLNDMETIRKSYAEGDMEVTHRIAHTLKGISATLGASNLLASSEALDSHIKAQQLEMLPELINGVDGALIPILESIKLKLIEADD